MRNYLLLSRVCITRKLESEMEPGLKSRDSNMDCRCPKLCLNQNLLLFCVHPGIAQRAPRSKGTVNSPQAELGRQVTANRKHPYLWDLHNSMEMATVLGQGSCSVLRPPGNLPTPPCHATGAGNPHSLGQAEGSVGGLCLHLQAWVGPLAGERSRQALRKRNCQVSVRSTCV